MAMQLVPIERLFIVYYFPEQNATERVESALRFRKLLQQHLLVDLQ